MPCLAYVPHKFKEDAAGIVIAARDIIQEYVDQGYVITLRQLYYQFVARDLLPNKQSAYNRLGDIINDARLAGYIDWDTMEDRTRHVRSNSHWDRPSDVLKSARDGYRIDKWATQPTRPEVWIEKDALVGVIEPICRRLDVSYFSCRGYASQSEMWRAGQRFKNRMDKTGQKTVVLHLGDHDPSGIDMSWDIWKRLAMFAGEYEWKSVKNYYDKETAFNTTTFQLPTKYSRAPVLKRLALNYAQVEQYDPPPNPAKFTDSRAETYVDCHGDSSWELDALEPAAMSELVEEAILHYRDAGYWDDAVAEEDFGRAKLTKIYDAAIEAEG